MDDLIIQASAMLQRGKLVCFPTETVYALAADSSNTEALERIYDLKGRDPNNPLAVLVRNVEMAHNLVEFNEKAEKIAAAFCPGPITLVLPKLPASTLARNVNPKLQTLAIRIPDHTIALQILQQINRPVAATSTNPSGMPPAMDAAQVEAYFGDKVDLILPTEGKTTGTASTIVDLCTETPKILRQGGITLRQIEEIL